MDIIGLWVKLEQPKVSRQNQASEASFNYFSALDDRTEIDEAEDEEDDVKPPQIETYSTPESYFHSPSQLKDSYERHLNQHDMAFVSYE